MMSIDLLAFFLFFFKLLIQRLSNILATTFTSSSFRKCVFC
jgi:hypothetical protein